ncbi:MAG: hypothetical protein M3094_02875 [Actinomycetia bacterium]|nr:hypothetical protein [Actinomycetes bacterium]
MRWAGFVAAIVVGGLVSLWAVRDHLNPGSVGFLASILVLGLVWTGWATVSGTLSLRWIVWHREWTGVASHPVAVSFGLFAVGLTGWMASGMVPSFPVGAAVVLAGSIGFLVSLVDHRLPALLVVVVALFGVASVTGFGLSSHESVSVETAIVVGVVLLATAVVSLLISGMVFRWFMVAVGSLAAGYVWSGIAVLQFAPLSVPFKRVAIAGVLGASIVALVLSLVARRLDGTGEVSSTEG